MNAGVYFVTQNTDDLLDEKLKNNLGLKFAFRSTDINEIKKTLAFFGVDSEDENNQKRSVTWKTDSALSVIYTGVWESYSSILSLKTCSMPLIPDRP